jgi:4'-phosphopantetheinyl transferase
MAEVHVSYSLTGELDEGALEGWLHLLSEEERARRARFVFARDRCDFAAAHLLLRRVLSVHEDRRPQDWTFVTGRNGKPMLDGGVDDPPGLSFNLAHTRGLVACVVAGGLDVGIDVEQIHRGVNNLDVARHYLAPTELTDLERCPVNARAEYFARIWTLKEAYLKATGEGISESLNRCAFAFEGAHSLRFAPADSSEGEACTFALFALEDYRLAVAVRGAAQPLTVRLRHRRCDGGLLRDDARLLRASSGVDCDQRPPSQP